MFPKPLKILSFVVISSFAFAQQGIAPSQAQQSTAQTQVEAQTQKKPDAAKTSETQKPAEASKAAEAAKSSTTSTDAQKPESSKETDKAEQKSDSKEALPQSDSTAASEAKPADPAAEPAVEPMIPETKIFPEPKEAIANDPLLAPAKKPDGKIALMGGVVKSIDQVRNRLTLSVFKSGTMKYRFDDRTRIMRDGLDVTQLAIKKGDRVYVDSQLEKGNLFARNIVIHTGKTEAIANGQVISYNKKSGEVSLRDPLSSQPVRFRIGPATEYRNAGKNASADELRQGSLVKVVLGVSPAERNTAKSVEILATPGTEFSFFGRVTHLDLRTGVIGINNRADDKLYEIRFNPKDVIAQELKIGAEVLITASFDGTKYAAKSLNVTKAPDADMPAEEEDETE